MQLAAYGDCSYLGSNGEPTQNVYHVVPIPSGENAPSVQMPSFQGKLGWRGHGKATNAFGDGRSSLRERGAKKGSDDKEKKKKRGSRTSE